jgi:hypothetical protein
MVDTFVNQKILIAQPALSKKNVSLKIKLYRNDFNKKKKLYSAYKSAT